MALLETRPKGLFQMLAYLRTYPVADLWPSVMQVAERYAHYRAALFYVYGFLDSVKLIELPKDVRDVLKRPTDSSLSDFGDVTPRLLGYRLVRGSGVTYE